MYVKGCICLAIVMDQMFVCLQNADVEIPPPNMMVLGDGVLGW